MTLKELRISKGLTQNEASLMCNIPLRTYKRYESNPELSNSIKMEYAINILNKYGYIDENTGILNKENIEKTCKDIFKEKKVEFAYLFGSYSKGTANEKSDVDLLVSTSLTGMSFFSLAEELRQKLHKKVDLLSLSQLNENPALITEILKTGVKIYG